MIYFECDRNYGADADGSRTKRVDFVEAVIDDIDGDSLDFNNLFWYDGKVMSQANLEFFYDAEDGVELEDFISGHKISLSQLIDINI